MVSSTEVTSRILTVIHEFGRINPKFLFITEYAEIDHFKLSFPCPRASAMSFQVLLHHRVIHVSLGRFTLRWCSAQALAGDAAVRREHAASQVWQGGRCPSNSPSQFPSGRHEDPQEFPLSFLQRKLPLAEPISQPFLSKSGSAATCRGSSASDVP